MLTSAQGSQASRTHLQTLTGGMAAAPLGPADIPPVAPALSPAAWRHSVRSNWHSQKGRRDQPPPTGRCRLNSKRASVPTVLSGAP